VKRNDFKIVQSEGFEVQVPSQCEILKHDLHEEQKRFFHSDLGKQSQASIGQAAIETLMGHFSFEVKIDNHHLIFHVEKGKLKPKDLEDFISSQTRSRIPTSDFNVGDIRGKAASSIWWLEKNGRMICFSLSGPKESHKDVHSIVMGIINSLKFAD
jgi:hypothetical protein